MSHRTVISWSRPVGLLFLIVFLMACSRLSTGAAGQASDLTLALKLSKEKYQPGEPVTAMVTLTNASGEPVSAAMLDHASVTFSVQPQKAGAASEQRFVEPLYSEKEQTGEGKGLGAGESLARNFVFTNLTFERGGFVLAAVYARPSDSPLRAPRKSYAKAAAFAVEGQKAFAHRYLSGLLAREDAIALATAKAGGKVQGADTLLITDEAGFAKWWVNLTLEGGAVKSWFIDPVFAQVWKEARPFTAADKGIDPQPKQDAQILQRLKEQSTQKRER